jgi:hypothetical protein
MRRGGHYIDSFRLEWESFLAAVSSWADFVIGYGPWSPSSTPRRCSTGASRSAADQRSAADGL